MATHKLFPGKIEIDNVVIHLLLGEAVLQQDCGLCETHRTKERKKERMNERKNERKLKHEQNNKAHV